MTNLIKIGLCLTVILTVAIPQAYAQRYSASESCLPEAYRKAMHFQKEGNWLALVAYTQASLECADFTNFNENPNAFLNQLRAVNQYAIDKVIGKTIEGISLTTPRLPRRLPN